MAVCLRSTFFNSNKQFFLKKFTICDLYYTTSSIKCNSGKKEIVIPFRKDRGPTDILKALASTVSKDFTAPHYKYEDDPYFIPASNVTKRVFALSKESGKKAARYFLEKYPELFICNTSQPNVKAFDPPVTYTENDVVSETNLEELILCSDVKNSIIVFNMLQKNGIELKPTTKQNLLELLCFYNCENPPSDEYYEERYYRKLQEDRRNTWKGNGMAEKLFKSMERNSKSYSAVICGAAKFNDAERAFALYEEMRSKNLTGTIHAYNSLLLLSSLVKETSDMRWEFAMNLLNEMKLDKVMPDIYTMNNLLEIISKEARWGKAKSIGLNILSEMKKINIEPSLGSYYYILRIFGGYGKSNALSEVMSAISGKEFHIRHPSDVNFFSTAMEHCWKFYQNKELAYCIHNLLEFQNNNKLLGNSFSESLYFKSFFQVLCETEDIDKFMEVYEKYVPNTYTPEPSVMLSIVQCVHLTGSYHHLPQLCSDVILFEQSEREDILCELISAISSMKHEKQDVLIEMVWKILENIERRSSSGRFLMQWTGELLGNILKTFLVGEDLDKAWSVMQKLQSDETKIVGYPEKEVLLKFCAEFHKAGQFEKVKFCIKYAINGSCPDFYKDLVSHGLLEYGEVDNKLGCQEQAEVKTGQ